MDSGWDNLAEEHSAMGMATSPARASIHALVDVDGLLSHYRRLSSYLGVTISALLPEATEPTPLVEGREMIWYGSPVCRSLAKGDSGCLDLHWRNAVEAMKACEPREGPCVCGENVLLSCPILLEYWGQRWAKACVTFSFVSGRSPRDAKRLTREHGVPLPRTEAFPNETLGDLHPAQQESSLRDSLKAMIARTSREISIAYAYHVAAKRNRLSEESLRHEKEKLHALIDNLGVGVTTVNREMTILWDAGGDGHSPAKNEAVGRKCYEVYGLRDSPCPSCPAATTFETGLPQSTLKDRSSADGERTVHQIKTAPITDATGVVSAVLVMAQEVTSHVKSMEEIARYRRLVDEVSDMVILTDEDGNLLAVNKSAPAVLGYRENEILGMNADEICVDAAALHGLAKEARTSGSCVGESSLRTKTGQVIAVELSITYSPKGRTYQSVCRDITARRSIEDELRKRTERLEEQHQKLTLATDQKTRFFASMSHELRTPMTSIVGFTELLLDDVEDPVSSGQRELLLKVSQNAHRLLGMINDLLDLSRMESGRITPTVAEVRLDRLLDQIVSNMMPLAKDKDLSLVTSSPVERSVYTDEQRLSQILVNLLSNAIKFTPSGRVEVRTQVNDGRFQIVVSDTGIGIRPSDIPKIFEEFHTGSESAKHRIPGTGLGLAITKKLTELLGGKITVASQIGKGSAFTVTLPNRPPKPQRGA